MSTATEGQAAAKRPARRRGRWTYDGTTGLYGEAGWHLDGTQLVIDFMPGCHQCCNGGRRCCHGCYLLYNWPGREHEPLSRFVDCAMEQVEEEYDALAADVGGAELANMLLSLKPSERAALEEWSRRLADNDAAIGYEHPED